MSQICKTKSEVGDFRQKRISVPKTNMWISVVFLVMSVTVAVVSMLCIIKEGL